LEKKSLNEDEELLLHLRANLGEIETLARILDISFHSNENLEPGDMENLSSVLLEKIFQTRQIFNDIEARRNL
jgi:hypothetical protein